MLSEEAINNVKLELKDCIRGMGYAATTIVLASLDAAIAKYSTVSDVSSDMVRRRDLEEMYNKIKVLEGTLAERDREIADLRKKLGEVDSKTKPVPAKQERAKGKGKTGG